MKQLAYIFAIIFTSILFQACSSVDGDAKKAVELSKESIDCIKKADLEKAEKLYKQSQDIISNYENTEQYEEFITAYNKYLENNIN